MWICWMEAICEQMCMLHTDLQRLLFWYLRSVMMPSQACTFDCCPVHNHSMNISVKLKNWLHREAVTKIPFPGSHTNDMHNYNMLMTCLLHIANLHHQRTKQKGCPVGSTYLANMHDVGGNMLMTSLLHMTNHHNKMEKNRQKKERGWLTLPTYMV